MIVKNETQSHWETLYTVMDRKMKYCQDVNSFQFGL